MSDMIRIRSAAGELVELFPYCASCGRDVRLDSEHPWRRVMHSRRVAHDRCPGRGDGLELGGPDG